jgi:hypothetical protein
MLNDPFRHPILPGREESLKKIFASGCEFHFHWLGGFYSRRNPFNLAMAVASAVGSSPPRDRARLEQ